MMPQNELDETRAQIVALTAWMDSQDINHRAMMLAAAAGAQIRKDADRTGRDVQELLTVVIAAVYGWGMGAIE